MSDSVGSLNNKGGRILPAWLTAAAKILCEDKRAALEEMRVIALGATLVGAQHLNTKPFRRERLSLVTCPRADTSIEKYSVKKYHHTLMHTMKFTALLILQIK